MPAHVNIQKDIRSFYYPLDTKKHKASMKFTATSYGTDMNGKTVVNDQVSCHIYTPHAITVRDSIQYDTIDLVVLDEVADIVKEISSGNLNLGQSLQVSLIGLGAVAKKFIAKTPTVKALTALTTGTVLNPNIGAMFKSPGLRPFTFTFNFLPNSKKESLVVKNIIKYFRKAAYPRIDKEASFLYKVPDTFSIQHLYEGVENENLIKIAQCACTGVDVIYNQNNTAFHEDGAPVEINLTVSFQEIRTLDENHINKGF